MLPEETDEYMGKPMASIINQIKTAKRMLKELRADSYNIRQKFLTSKERKKEIDESPKNGLIRKKKIGAAERQSRIHRKIGRNMKPNERQSLSHIVVPTENG